MKIAVIGTGLIGSQVVNDLVEAGHEAAGHSRSTGIDILTGAGLDQAMSGAQVVVDVTNSPTFDEASIDFFRTSVPHLSNAAQAAGVRHFVTLSIVGTDKVPDLAYYRAKTPIQPISAAEVAAAVAEVAGGEPLQGTREIAGPDVFTLDDLGRITLAAAGDQRHVVIDDAAGLFAAVKGDALIASAGAHLAPTHYRDWLSSH